MFGIKWSRRAPKAAKLKQDNEPVLLPEQAVLILQKSDLEITETRTRRIKAGFDKTELDDRRLIFKFPANYEKRVSEFNDFLESLGTSSNALHKLKDMPEGYLGIMYSYSGDYLTVSMPAAQVEKVAKMSWEQAQELLKGQEQPAQIETPSAIRRRAQKGGGFTPQF